jgi:pimeloyl-ACP methyl ester carboxylesterase
MMFNFDGNTVLQAANATPAFRLAARFWTADVLFKMGAEFYRLVMKDGQITGFSKGGGATPAEITISGPGEAWEKLFAAVPPPSYDDPLLIGQRVGFKIEAKVTPDLAPYYSAIREFIDVLRRLRSGPPPALTVPDVNREFDSVIGRYMYVSVQGTQYRIYFEEAGRGPVPLILQHTAAADNRQWRHLMEDPDFQRMFRIISYDLPYHGKSVPPTSVRWWEEQYTLTKSMLIETVVAIADRLQLDRPVFMGCSVGGFLAPDLALEVPDRFRAVIGINSGLGMDLAHWPTDIEQSYLSPRVSSAWLGSVNIGLTAPTSPEALRREVGWVYSQSAPTVIYGDINYYAHEHRLTAEEAGRIDTSKVAVYLLTCEYDALAYEDGTAQLAKAIKGSHFQIVPALGHFGPAENPEAFKAALLPLFKDIAKLA